ncbi:class I SAM-dependent methyltransferase [Methylophilus sp. OH31]|uniref:class I SAM-dependent methyltransferase n=1 Tax=Methylophilus sp. OH31 TaxID=1387312 RepID=UPI000463591F|nr:class I SAM-dependent methyltransferase [Methylophilus sp. OH31]
MTNNALLNDVANYYSQKVEAFGTTPQGVDWNGEDSQFCRFEQLLKVINKESEFSLIDVGCGYGAMLGYMLEKLSTPFDYIGLDISEEMIQAAIKTHPKSDHIQFFNGSTPPANVDYAVASGIFNVRLEQNDELWLAHIMKTIEQMNAYTRKGFAFNCLTSYSDEDKKRDYLYYADPGLLFDFCKKHCSKQVALLHDYGLYEFTIIVRK